MGYFLVGRILGGILVLKGRLELLLFWCFFCMLKEEKSIYIWEGDDYNLFCEKYVV